MRKRNRGSTLIPVIKQPRLPIPEWKVQAMERAALLSPTKPARSGPRKQEPRAQTTRVQSYRPSAALLAWLDRFVTASEPGAVSSRNAASYDALSTRLGMTVNDSAAP